MTDAFAELEACVADGDGSAARAVLAEIERGDEVLAALATAPVPGPH